MLSKVCSGVGNSGADGSSHEFSTLALARMKMEKSTHEVMRDQCGPEVSKKFGDGPRPLKLNLVSLCG